MERHESCQDGCKAQRDFDRKCGDGFCVKQDMIDMLYTPNQLLEAIQNRRRK